MLSLAWFSKFGAGIVIFSLYYLLQTLETMGSEARFLFFLTSASLPMTSQLFSYQSTG